MGFNPFLNNSSGGGSGTAGKDGRGITSITFASSDKGDTPNISGATDTYKISYTDGTTSTFTIYNGTNGESGEDGKEVELKVSETAIQWKYSDDKNWIDLILLSELKGLDGESVALRTDSNNIQWKKDNDTEWTNLIPLTELKGSDGFSPVLEITAIDGGNKLDITDASGTKSLQILNGSNGKEIELGKDDINIKWRYVGDNSWKVLIPLSSLKGKNGTSITSIAFTSSNKGEVAGLAGATDTYTITLSDNTTSTFSVYNGKDGSGGSGSGFSGDYNDLINKPTIPTVSNDLTDELKKEYDSAYEKSHTHDNKEVLDTITSESIEKWDNITTIQSGLVGKKDPNSRNSSGEIFNNYSANKATGDYSHAEGHASSATGNYSHAEGDSSAAGSFSHAEGDRTKANGSDSHAEGELTIASGQSSHSEGSGSQAIGMISHAEGTETIASGSVSHSEGEGTISAGDCQHVQGKYNKEDKNNQYSFIIGNGERGVSGNEPTRSNAFAIDWSGNIYVGNTDEGVNVAELKQYSHTHDNLEILNELDEDYPIRDLMYKGEKVFKVEQIDKSYYDYLKEEGALLSNWLYVITDEVDTPQLEDTGWTTLSITDESSITTTSLSKINYRKIGKVVYIEGYFQAKQNESSLSEIPIGVMPTGYRPLNSSFGINSSQIVDDNHTILDAFVRISSSGIIMLCKKNSVELTTSTHYFFNISYLCD